MADNTIYVLSLSYGKDSLSCLGAIEKLGLPLDRIVHAEVWATQDIPADLPPMVEFKAKADKIIKDRYGIEVEHVCAVNKNGGGCSLTKPCLVEQPVPQSTDSTSTASQSNKVLGVQASSNKTCLPKLTYEDIFYRERVNRRGGVCTRLTDSQCKRETGATTFSKSTRSTVYGFPYGSWMGGWCRELKTSVFKKPEHDGRYKYRAISWHCCGRDRKDRTSQRQERHNATACHGGMGRSLLPKMVRRTRFAFANLHNGDAWRVLVLPQSRG